MKTAPLLTQPIPLRIVSDIDNLRFRGDAFIFTNEKLNCKQLIMVCPACGTVSGSAGKHIYNEQTKTYTPSIVHNKELRGCGWHGYLKEGKFVNA